MLIRCLHYWNQVGHLKWPKRVSYHRRIAHALLAYFAKFSHPYSLSNLRNLPIFETFDGGQFVHLMEKRAYTLDEQTNLPVGGQKIWMSKTLFLMKRYNFMILYEDLNIDHIEVPGLYADFIIPSFPEMTTSDQVEHLNYLRNYYKFNKGLTRALEILKETQFIQASDGNLKSVNQFYDYTVPLFAEMCCKDDFLPQYFVEALKTVNDNWMKVFLHKLGLKYIPEPQEHVQFALQLSKLSLDRSLDKIGRVSKLLLKSVVELSSSYSDSRSPQWHSCIIQMSDIAFIPSMKFNENFRSLFPSTTLDSIKLMKTNGSFSSVCQTLVWTVSRVLPSWVPSNLHEKMGVVTLENPSCLELSIEHFEKLLDHLFLAKLKQQKDIGINGATSIATLQDVLNDLYLFLKGLQSKGSIDDNDRLKLMKLPLVIVEDGHYLAYPEMVVERLPVTQRKHRAYYAPFLYELPPDLHKYKVLFQTLGLQEELNVWHYATYLHKAYTHFTSCFSENEVNLDPNIRQSIMFVQKAMVMSADDTFKWDNIKSLYLLSLDRKLYKSCQLVFQDRSAPMQAPQNTKSLKFWECSPSPDHALQKKMAEFVKLLPCNLKLKLSSEVLAESVCVEKSENCQNQPCLTADRLLNLFPSAEFFECIQRLYSAKNDSVDFKNSRWIEIGEKLKNIQIHCYSKLIIEMKDLEHSVEIENSQKPCNCFFDGKKLLISHEVSSEIFFANQLTCDLQQFLSITVSEAPLLVVLFKCSDPCELEIILEELGVPELTKKSLSLPVLGNPVPDESVHFLEMHPLNCFRNGEYVAFLISDVEPEADPLHNFIWAKIICCVDDDSTSALSRHYKISIGESSDPIIVSALDLHKYMTLIKTSEPSPLVPIDIEAEPQSQSYTLYNRNLTEEEACNEVTQILEEARNLSSDEYKKVRIRLYLTWHPDKNTEDKKALATVVFQHLQREIERLENGGGPAGHTFNTGQPFRAWDFFRSNTNRRWNDYSHGRSQNPFNDFNFRYHTPHEYPNPNMADKYWKTANDDLKAAFDARQCQNIETGKEIGNEHVIILAQQAVEKALKAVMFAEIGTAEKHHHLPSLAQRASNSTRCSKDVVHKVSEFVSECGTDLTHLRYPEGHVSRPHITYSELQAVKAVQYSMEIVDDLRKAYPAFKL